MANYYTHYSFLVPFELPDQSETATKLLVQRLTGELEILIEDAIEHDGNDLFDPDSNPGEMRVRAEGTEVWIYDDSGDGSVESAVIAVEWLLGKPGAPKSVGFEWANTCSKPRPDGFGGGAVLVTLDSTRWMTTGGWLVKAMGI